jgi:hypothetical protein
VSNRLAGSTVMCATAQVVCCQLVTPPMSMRRWFSW